MPVRVGASTSAAGILRLRTRHRARTPRVRFLARPPLRMTTAIVVFTDHSADFLRFFRNHPQTILIVHTFSTGAGQFPLERHDALRHSAFHASVDVLSASRGYCRASGDSGSSACHPARARPAKRRSFWQGRTGPKPVRQVRAPLGQGPIRGATRVHVFRRPSCGRAARKGREHAGAPR